MRLIGIAGRAGAGKSTVARHLALRHGYVEVGLADAIKRFARDLWHFSDEQLFGESARRNSGDARYAGLTPRHVLQTIGSDVRRIDPDAWIRVVLRAADELLDGSNRWVLAYTPTLGLHFDAVRDSPPAGVVIPDCRYRNEVEAMRAAGGRVLRLVRPGAWLVGAAGQHASEIDLDELPDEAFDAVIVNDGTPGDLAGAIDVWLATRGGREPAREAYGTQHMSR